MTGKKMEGFKIPILVTLCMLSVNFCLGAPVDVVLDQDQIET